MPKYNVYLVATASTVVEVEADSGDEAVERAFDSDLPYAEAFAGFDLSEWTTPSEVYGSTASPDEDYEEVE